MLLCVTFLLTVLDSRFGRCLYFTWIALFCAQDFYVHTLCLFCWYKIRVPVVWPASRGRQTCLQCWRTAHVTAHACFCACHRACQVANSICAWHRACELSVEFRCFAQPHGRTNVLTGCLFTTAILNRAQGICCAMRTYLWWWIFKYISTPEFLLR